MLSSTSLSDRPGLHPGTGYFIGPRVPHGLAAVVEGLTREVLRHRPEDIYVFAAHHFEKLLNLREQYHAEGYHVPEFDDEFNREFNLWPTKESKRVTGGSSTSGWSPDKEIEVLERRKEISTGTEQNSEDISTNSEKQRTSKHAHSRSPSNTRKSSKRGSNKDKESTSDPRATRIISQMSALHDHSKSILTKNIKQELRKNKLNSNEKGKATDPTEKGIRGERRSRTRLIKSDKKADEETERLTSTTSTSKVSTRRTLKKVRRIETESETETEHDIAAKAGLENDYHKSRVKGDNREAIVAQTGSRERKSEEAARLSEHSSERKVSSRALSMDRIRAYVLRKFASTASLEVLRSPTYVEQVQEVIDRAAPIIKEKLDEIRRPRGKRSRSVDLAWNEESFRRYTQGGKRSDEEKESKQEEVESDGGKDSNGFAQKTDNAKRAEKDETISNAEKKDNKRISRRRADSVKNSRRRESRGHDDLTAVVDRADDDLEHGNKSEHEADATRDTLEARLTATQSILEDISKSASELGGARTTELVGSGEQEPLESEISVNTNVISLPIVRPPSSKNCKNTTKNGTDSLILPPISPEAPKSTKKKDELSLPILSTATNGNHTAKISQEEQEDSKDGDEASTMRDVTSDMEDMAALSENEHDSAIVNTKQDLSSDRCQSPMSDVRPDEAKAEDDRDEVLEEDVPLDFAKKQDASDGSFDRGTNEKEEPKGTLEEKKEEIFKDSLNVTPEVVDVPPRPDSLEPQEEDEQEKSQDYEADSVAQGNTSDGLKDKLIEIEMAERSIEKALAGQRAAAHDSEMKSEAGNSASDEGAVNGIEEAANDGTTSEMEGSMDEVDGTKCDIGKSMSNGENINNKTIAPANKIDEAGESADETLSSEGKAATDQPDILTAVTKEGSSNTARSANSAEELSPVIEELAIKRQVKDLQSVNLQDKKEVAEVSECRETDDNDDDTTKGKTVPANESSETTGSGNEATESENVETHRPDGDSISKTKARKKRELDESSATTPLSLKIPFSYVLSEGSPCEIPDSVTTVIIPDRPCPSPVTSDNEDHQLDLTSLPEKEESVVRCDIIEDISLKEDDTREDKDRGEYGMEAFGEYIRPEAAALPVDIDFVRGVKSAKSSQDIIIVHQDLDRIKEEDEEEKKDDVQGETDKLTKKEDDEGTIAQDEETVKLAALEDIMEHEENEEVNARTIRETESVEEISHIPLNEPSLDTANADTTSKDRADGEIRSTLENSSEDSGSSQDTHTITSSDVKESTVSNRSIESPSIGRPIVPELNLDSLQDNTVSSFKMTANGTTTKESNGSPKESDTTMSLIEPLTPDERVTTESHLVLPDRAEPAFMEEFSRSLSRDLQSDIPEAEQLYRAEHAEYAWLENDPLSTEAILEEKMKSQVEDETGLKIIPEDTTYADLILKEKEKGELSSEEEIARELINSLDKEIQLCVKELTPREEFSVGEEFFERNLEMDDKSNQPLSESVRTKLTNEPEETKSEVILEGAEILDKGRVTKTEALIELSNHAIDIKQEHKDKNPVVMDEEIKSILKVEEKDPLETQQTAPLAQFEEDEFLQQNGSCQMADKKITDKNEHGIVDIDDIVNQERPCKKQEANEQIESYVQEVRERKNSIVLEEGQQGKLNDNKVCERGDSKSPEEYKQANLELPEKDDQNNLKSHDEEVVAEALSSETESRVSLRKKSIENNNNVEYSEADSIKLITHEKLVINDDLIENDAKNEKENNILLAENLPIKSENVPESMSVISEQSTEDCFDLRNWTKETKSSTMETVIVASDSNNTHANEKALGDASKIVKDESITREINEKEFYSAVVKLQACTRGFLARRHSQKARGIATAAHSAVPENRPNLRESKSGRYPLRREEALRKTTLSLENAFATGRLQHTGEFHDSVPLPLYDTSDSETNSSILNESLDKEEIEEAQAKLDNANSNTHERTDSHCQDRNCHGSFQNGNIFVDHSTLPIMMHLLTDMSRNHYDQSSGVDLNPNLGAAKFMEPMVDILMLGYPRDDVTLQNRYLNFITSVEDTGLNMDSLPMNNATKITKDSDDVQSSITSGEVSLREPLALPGTPQGVVIEELTSLDEAAEDIPSARSESIKPSTPLKTSLDTNSSVIPEESALEENEENDDLGSSSRTSSADKGVVNGDMKNTDEGIEKELKETSIETNGTSSKLENVKEIDSRDETASVRANEISHASNGQTDKEKNEKT